MFTVIKMKKSKILYSLEALINGQDPCTGDFLYFDSIYQDDMFLDYISNAALRLHSLLDDNIPPDYCRDKEVWRDDELNVLMASYKNGVSVGELSKRHLRSVEKIAHKLSHSHMFDKANNRSSKYNKGMFRRSGNPWTELEYRLISELCEEGFASKLSFMLIRDPDEIPASRYAFSNDSGLHRKFIRNTLFEGRNVFEFVLDCVHPAFAITIGHYKRGDIFSAKDYAIEYLRKFSSRQGRVNWYPHHQRIINLLVNIIIISGNKDEISHSYHSMCEKLHCQSEIGIEYALESDFFTLALKLLYGAILKGYKDGEDMIANLCYNLNHLVFMGEIYDFDEASAIYNNTVSHLSNFGIDLDFFKSFRPGKNVPKKRVFPVREQFYKKRLLDYCGRLKEEIAEEVNDNDILQSLVLGFNEEIEEEIAIEKERDENQIEAAERWLEEERERYWSNYVDPQAPDYNDSDSEESDFEE